ncbi:MAG TPA: hypothetical protein PLX72_09720, partial [Candidatus Syntrophosphaera sp.]|nr:hypothetical protein [Candidatus Syntrophosphaera sp.]
MRKYLPSMLAAVLLACAPLVAQPQELPSVEIRSDAAVKAPLVKKPLLFPGDNPPDSIPPRIPPVFSLRHKQAAPPRGTIRPFHLELSTGTDFE